MIGIEDRDQVVVRAAAGHRGDVVRAVDRDPIEDVVGARMRTARILAWPSRLSSAATRSTERRGWTFESNRSPATRKRVHLLGQGEIDGGLERRELALSLGGRLLAEIVVSRAEMDVCGVDEPQHPLARLASLAVVRTIDPGASPVARVGSNVARARRPHDSPLAGPTVAGHCDRYGVSVAVPIRPAVVSCRSLHRCAPRQGHHIDTWVVRPRHSPPDLARPVCRCGRPRPTHPCRSTRLGGAP